MLILITQRYFLLGESKRKETLSETKHCQRHNGPRVNCTGYCPLESELVPVRPKTEEQNCPVINMIRLSSEILLTTLTNTDEKCVQQQ